MSNQIRCECDGFNEECVKCGGSGYYSPGGYKKAIVYSASVPEKQKSPTVPIRISVKGLTKRRDIIDEKEKKKIVRLFDVFVDKLKLNGSSLNYNIIFRLSDRTEVNLYIPKIDQSNFLQFRQRLLESLAIHEDAPAFVTRRLHLLKQYELKTISIDNRFQSEKRAKSPKQKQHKNKEKEISKNQSFRIITGDYQTTFKLSEIAVFKGDKK